MIAAALPPGRFPRLGVAVSGGSDSLALLHLLADRAAARTGAAGTALAVVTVDHGLRPEAADEAAMVARVAAGLGLPHQVLRWRGWDGRGNLPDAARRARYGLMADWARAQGIAAVALGHTADDQAETFMMRLARGAGVDGLSAMAPERRAQGILWLRPLLAARRADLRAALRARGVGWADDPTNADPAYARIRARAALAALEPLGLGVPVLAEVSAHLREVRAALDAQTHAAAQALTRAEAGDLVIDRAGLAALPVEIRRRLLAAALRWIATSDYTPRGADLARLMRAVEAGQGAALHGCLARPEGANLRLCREPAAVAGVTARPGDLWDGRWRLTGPATAEGCQIAALGEAGLAQCPDWRASGRPRLALSADPAVWRAGHLAAAPLAGLALGWQVELARDFPSSLFSH
ncbi:tRNA lysidine(34) synthetase TilS [Rhodobacter veldkampii DSM 11550]|uniref:tRNA(Ile)-lysidine synthase n=1 Tax=Phaeovulum veldkampii DSM 11550 TaxID=1185920 RepID=A0A2T4JKF3_9RHOB|nr:tRNA lysidine(34) synthetase TilS [Phaeovulum veldkampii]MBK5945432.1 tRNA lysidine(34) synthetase TilS [Phaeovulum veldkampii DSM 11550]PTE18364.1 tRNA lysidine(34) synthetase TilS [Phaeovulum veldkampii DSM 11550]